MGQTNFEQAHCPNNSVNAAERSHLTNLRIEISDRALSIVAIVLAALAIGILITFIPLVDAKVQAGAAQAEATAREARSTAKVTDDKLDELRDHLNATGMKIPRLDGH